MINKLIQLKGLPSMAALSREIGWSKQRLKAAADSPNINGQLILDVCKKWPDLAFNPGQGFFIATPKDFTQEGDATSHLPTIETFGRGEIAFDKKYPDWVRLWATTRQTSDIEVWTEGDVTHLGERFGQSAICFVA